MIRLASLVLAVALTGCATCERHPVVCTVGTAVLAGSIAVAANHSHAGEFERRIVVPVRH